MQHSEQIGELAAALAKAQGQIVGALKDSTNPYFKSKYADLASCWEAVRKPLSDNGLAVIQTTGTGTTPEWAKEVILATTLIHSSGQWIVGYMPLKTKDDSPQAQGSALTYARRYALAAIVGLAQIDDDGNTAQGRNPDGSIPANVDINPRGEDYKSVDPNIAQSLADEMRTILEADMEEDTRALRVDDFKVAMRGRHDEYTAAWSLMTSAERSAFKKYAAMAEEVRKRKAEGGSKTGRAGR